MTAPLKAIERLEDSKTDFILTSYTADINEATKALLHLLDAMDNFILKQFKKEGETKEAFYARSYKVEIASDKGEVKAYAINEIIATLDKLASNPKAQSEKLLRILSKSGFEIWDYYLLKLKSAIPTASKNGDES
jgi:hypothetical protein